MPDSRKRVASVEGGASDMTLEATAMANRLASTSIVTMALRLLSDAGTSLSMTGASTHGRKSHEL